MSTLLDAPTALNAPALDLPRPSAPAMLAEEPQLEVAPDLTGTRPLGYRVATAIGFLINPLVLPPISFGLVLAHFGATGGEIAWIVTVAVVFFGLVPLGYIGWMVATGRARSVEVRERGKRTGPLAAGVIGYLVGIVVMALTGTTAVPLIVALALTFPVNTLVVLLITLRFKISIHVVAVAGFVAGLLFVALAPWPGLPEPAFLRVGAVLAAGLMVPLVMWARVHAKAHTLPQVLLGAAFGFALPLAELWLAWQAGWLG